jgi:hypothetical protein
MAVHWLDRPRPSPTNAAKETVEPDRLAWVLSRSLEIEIDLFVESVGPQAKDVGDLR